MSPEPSQEEPEPAPLVDVRDSNLADLMDLENQPELAASIERVVRDLRDPKGAILSAFSNRVE